MVVVAVKNLDRWSSVGSFQVPEHLTRTQIHTKDKNEPYKFVFRLLMQ